MTHLTRSQIFDLQLPEIKRGSSRCDPRGARGESSASVEIVYTVTRLRSTDYAKEKRTGKLNKQENFR